MKIIGMGIDLVETQRIAQSIQRFGPQFIDRIFLPGEIEYSQSQANPHLHFAARFAAKEALSKAFGTGIGREVGWLDLEIIRPLHQCPKVALHGAAQAYAERLGVQSILISLSHTENYGLAQALLLG